MVILPGDPEWLDMLSEIPQQLNGAALVLTWLSGLSAHPRTLRLMISCPRGWLSHPGRQCRQSASGSTGPPARRQGHRGPPYLSLSLGKQERLDGDYVDTCWVFPSNGMTRMNLPCEFRGPCTQN